MSSIRRREFITLLGGAAAAWPLSPRAQERMRRVGVLTALAETETEVQRWFVAFQESLQKLGWEQGRNIRVEYRFAGGDDQRLRSYAAELVGMAPDVLVGQGRSRFDGSESGNALGAGRVRAGFRS